LPLTERLLKLFYILPYWVITAQKKAGKNAKSGEEMRMLSHFSKSDNFVTGGECVFRKGYTRELRKIAKKWPVGRNLAG
jgi:hypothetical protein